ncbi:MAG: hypothetical protein HOW73_12640 [Polyangiaceae bacterium]|nr:hypothetical protein [Polyangiaceae bacterium]
MEHPPPCCASCPELSTQARACRLLAEPGVQQRARMKTMPCDVRRLMRLRLRAHGDDVVAEALARWEAVDTPIAELSAPNERAPLDARVWLSPWPLSLVAKHMESRFGDSVAPVVGDALPANDAPGLVALARLQRVDPTGFTLLVERIRSTFDAVSWRTALGESDAQIEERVILALYRFLVLRGDVLSKIADVRARVCLAARRFRSGDGSDLTSLRAARGELDDPALMMAAFRALELEGARLSLAHLRAETSFSVLLSPAVEASFRRALRLQGGDDGRFDPAMIDPLLAFIDRDIDACAPRTPDGHPSVRDIAWFAAGEVAKSAWGPLNAQSPRNRALSHVEHLLVCRDGRCLERLHGEVCGREAVARVLSSPMSEPPPPSHRGLPIAMASGAASPHMIRCRDVLWETFAAMAQDEGRAVDDLVEEAMDRYRVLRTHLRRDREAPSEPTPEPTPEAPETRRSSAPPPSGKTGLRLGSASWMPRTDTGSRASTTSRDAPPPSSPASEEPTIPNQSNEITTKRPR